MKEYCIKDQRGAAHLFLAAIIVVGLACFGAYYYISSSAATFDASESATLDQEDTEEIEKLQSSENDDIAADIVTERAATRNPEALQVKVATYNILGAGALMAPDFNAKHGTNNTDRTKRAAAIIDKMNAPVVGIQEADSVGNQFNILKAELATRGYSLYPSTMTGTDRQWMRPIAFKTYSVNSNGKSFGLKFINGGKIMYPYQDAPKIRDNPGNTADTFQNKDAGTWALFEQKGRRFYVINVHAIAQNTPDCRWDCNPPSEPGGSDRGGAQKRQAMADIVYQQAQSLSRAYPVLVTGDFNSLMAHRTGNKAWRDRGVERPGLPYCTLTRGGVLRHAYDIARGTTGTCPTTSNQPVSLGGGVDQLYASSQLSIVSGTGPRAIVSGATKTTSDHTPFVATFTTAR